MDPLNETELEIEIHDLLCGDLPQPRRREVLAMIARDDRARKALESLLTVQERSRAAFGYQDADEAMEAGLSRLKDAMKPKPAGVAPGC